MNILQTVWSALTTQNEILTKLIIIPLGYIDALVGALFFTNLLNITIERKQLIFYVLFYGTIANILSFIIPSSFAIFANIIIWPIIIYFVFKTSILKSIASVAVTLIFTSVLESIILNLFFIIAKINYQDMIQIPLYRFITMIIIYGIMYLLTTLMKYLKFKINIIETFTLKNKILLAISIFLILVVICIQFTLLSFYSDTMPILVSLINVLILIIYFTISICNLISISNLEVTKRDLESANLTIHSLTILHDTVRSFKHDFDNIVNGIGGYVVTEDIDGLKRFYNQLLEDCQKTNNLYALSPNVINHPAIYHILATKYYDADQKNVTISLNVFLDLNEIEQRMKIYDFTRILGILLDNAIDAATECEKKQINVTFRKEINKNDLILVIIQNTYKNKDVDTERIYQKGITSKENHSGLGLWKIRQILMKNNNLNLYTTKNDEFFTQQFEIYK